MTDKDPTTREEALALALDWAASRRSHWNTFVKLGGDEIARAAAIAECARADAAEVVKWAALAAVLPERPKVNGLFTLGTRVIQPGGMKGSVMGLGPLESLRVKWDSGIEANVSIDVLRVIEDDEETTEVPWPRQEGVGGVDLMERLKDSLTPEEGR